MDVILRSEPPVRGARGAAGRGLTWSEAVYLTNIHGKGFHPPAHMRGMSLAELEAKAREETRGVREAQAAKERAARIESAPKSIERALLDGPKAQSSKPAQRGWR